MPVGQGARNNIVLGGLGRPSLFDTNVKATSIDEDIFSDQTEVTAVQDADLVLVLDTSETPDKIKFITHANLTAGFPALTGSTDNTVVTVTGTGTIAGEANLLFDGTILTNDGGEVDIDISSGDPHLSFQIGGTDKFTIGVDDDDSDKLKIDTGGTVGGATKLTMDSSGNIVTAAELTIGSKLKMPSNTADKLLIADGTSFEEVAIGDLSEISSVANDDVLVAIDTDAGSLKKITRSTLVAGLSAGTEISNVVEDSTPQLGGDLDVNSNNIVSTSNGNISLLPNGSGKVIADGDGSSGGISLSDGVIDIRTGTGSVAKVLFYCESSNAHAQTLQAQPHSAGVTNTLTLPAGSSSTLVSLVSTDTLTNKTLTTPKIAEIDSLSSGSITLDAEADIILDADGANIIFKDDGTSILDIANSSSDVEFTVSTADKNFAIKGTDGSSAITALDIDMALAGKATFNGDVVVGGDLTITGDDLFMNTNTAGHILVGDDTNYNPVAVSGDVSLASNGAVTIANNAVESGMLNNNIISGLTEITSGLADADELLYSDAGTIKRVGLDTLSTKILTGNATTATDATNSSHVLVTDNESTDENNLITFVEDGTSSTGNVGLEMDGNLTYNPSSGTLTATNLAGTLTTAAQTNITSVGTLTTLTVDNVITNGTTIGHTDDTDLMTLADGVLTVAGEVSMTTLDIGGTNVGSTAAELNLLDGSAKSTSSITIADSDAFIVIDGTTSKQIPASDIKTYAAGAAATKGFATAMAIAL